MSHLIFKTSIRNLLKNKLLTTINVLGLAVGITCALVIYLVISHEQQFDKHHTSYNKIFRLHTLLKFGDQEATISGIPYPFYEVLKTEVPQVKSVAQLFVTEGNFKIPSNTENRFITGNAVAGVDTAYFNIMDWQWVSGNPQVSLANANNIVLTEKTAKNLFGSLEVIGKEVYLNRDFLLTVTGLVANPSKPSNFEFSAFVSHKLLEKKVQEYASWTSVGSSFETLVLLDAEDSNLAQQSVAFHTTINKIYAKKLADSDMDWKMGMQALEDIHFGEGIAPITGNTASKHVLLTLAVIAFIIVFSACINYINLSTAFSALRSREISIRKILGSSKKQLVFQFMVETYLLVILALFVSLGLSELFLINMETITGWSSQEHLLRNALLQDINIYLFVPFLVLLITLLAGFYPAFLSASSTSLQSFKSGFGMQKVKGINLRRLLVIVQFAICQLFIFGIIVVLQQLKFTKEKSLGFNKDQVLSMTLNREDIAKGQVFKNRVQTLSGVNKVGLSNLTPITKGWTIYDIFTERDSSRNAYAANTIIADQDFFDVYEFNFLAGGIYPETDSMTHIVVNQAFLKWLGVDKPQEAIGQEVFLSDTRALIVTGVVADFHLTSFHSQIKPAMMGMVKESFQMVNVKISPQNTQETLASLAAIWKELFPDTPFKYNYLEDTVYRMYQDEEKLFNMFNLFAGLAIFISCLGLYGLVVFMSIQKTKEIGIRKVLGATITQVVMLFSKEFLWLVPTALFIAGPLGFYFMDLWLNDFAYHISIEAQYFLLTLCISLTIALITVAYQSFRAASKKPVEALHAD